MMTVEGVDRDRVRRRASYGERGVNWEDPSRDNSIEPLRTALNCTVLTCRGSVSAGRFLCGRPWGRRLRLAAWSRGRLFGFPLGEANAWFIVLSSRGGVAVDSKLVVEQIHSV